MTVNISVTHCPRMISSFVNMGGTFIIFECEAQSQSQLREERNIQLNNMTGGYNFSQNTASKFWPLKEPRIFT